MPFMQRLHITRTFVRPFPTSRPGTGISKITPTLSFSAATRGDVKKAIEQERTAIFFGLQNPSPIEDDIGLVEVCHALGIRFMQLTYNNQSLLATGCYEAVDTGVTRFGRQVIAEMNRVGMVIDMSHSSERSTLETIEISARPIAITHANPSWWHNGLRSKSDTVLRALTGSGGMLGFSMYAHHLKGGASCTLQSFCEMIAESASRYGAENLGIGSDLCQDQPDSIVTWMRNGRWSKTTDYGEGTASEAGWPQQALLVQQQSVADQYHPGPERRGFLAFRSVRDHGRELVALLWPFFRPRGLGRTGCRAMSAGSASRLRSPDEVMQLKRLGASFPTRLSFTRSLLRRLAAEKAKVSRPLWDIDGDGYGRAVYSVVLAGNTYSLVAFSTRLADEDRTDRVIAEAWDTSFVLYDGTPDASELDRLSRNAPLQEAGRFRESDLVLSRANKSVRFFEHVVARLASGRQPDRDLVLDVGYLMRTTAVYGNGKFGIADRFVISQRPEMAGPFQAEMLAVWLIRGFSHDLVEHMARCRSPETCVSLQRSLKQHLGMGNSTGLGMAPFLVHHPALLNAWITAREKALAMVLGGEAPVKPRTHS